MTQGTQGVFWEIYNSTGIAFYFAQHRFCGISQDISLQTWPTRKMWAKKGENWGHPATPGRISSQRRPDNPFPFYTSIQGWRGHPGPIVMPFYRGAKKLSHFDRRRKPPDRQKHCKNVSTFIDQIGQKIANFALFKERFPSKFLLIWVSWVWGGTADQVWELFITGFKS